ncbi:MAG TPA: hypothetical protein DCQ43_08060 [Treponema sp.]|nr:hypothetical protein [Treponema sp.]
MSRLKLVMQHDERDCGPACVSMILRYYGREIPLYRLRSQACTDCEGNSISGTGGLISASAGYGLYLDSKNENLLSLSQTMMMTPAFRTAEAELQRYKAGFYSDVLEAHARFGTTVVYPLIKNR